MRYGDTHPTSRSIRNGEDSTESVVVRRHRIGHSKVFFRAGVLGYLEEVRDDIVIKLTRWLQGACWGHLRLVDNPNIFESETSSNKIEQFERHNFGLDTACGN